VGRRICSTKPPTGRGDGGHCERSTHFTVYARFYLLGVDRRALTSDDAAEAFDHTVARASHPRAAAR
jgi:hypothetical protein